MGTVTRNAPDDARRSGHVDKWVIFARVPDQVRARNQSPLFLIFRPFQSGASLSVGLIDSTFTE